MNIVDRVKNILLNPRTEWLAIEAEQPNAAMIMRGYVIPLAIVIAIAAFVGFGFVGIPVMGVRFASIEAGLFNGVLHLLVSVLGVYISANVVDALAPSFDSEKHLGRSLQLVAYGCTPLLVARVFSVIPAIAGLISLAGLCYTAYVWYIGLSPIKRTPDDKKVVYLAVIFLVMVVIFLLTGIIVSIILRPFFGLAYGGFGYYGL
ncbi:Yip1 family protein [Deminuibacter soli]|uniref:YIP1 family protein n=1 Tax=Deminuibacter soli TaxID=2291815 RepID=A0A3E1NRN1_9BACT|nr:Yip1 family protein [Deminuibacter soli]RFM30570.1 YIP1 family protein [Deminuibacter soli]